jgi:hypothetical protein
VQTTILSSRRFVEKNLSTKGCQKPEAKATSGRNIKVDCKTQTEADSRQRDWQVLTFHLFFIFLLNQHIKHIYIFLNLNQQIVVFKKRGGFDLVCTTLLQHGYK